MKVIISFLTLLFLIQAANAQSAKNLYSYWKYGLKVDYYRNSITGMRNTLILDAYNPSTYQTQDQIGSGYGASFFISKKLGDEDSKLPLFFHQEFSYSYHQSFFKYQDIEGLEYEVESRYQYVNLLTAIRCNPFMFMENDLSGFHVMAAVRLSFNSGDRLFYSDNRSHTDDHRISYAMMDVIKGRFNVSPCLGVGYEYEWDNSFGLFVQGRWYPEIKEIDMVETLPNNYYFQETSNAFKSWSLSIGFSYSLLGEDKY